MYLIRMMFFCLKSKKSLDDRYQHLKPCFALSVLFLCISFLLTLPSRHSRWPISVLLPASTCPTTATLTKGFSSFLSFRRASTSMSLGLVFLSLGVATEGVLAESPGAFRELGGEPRGGQS